jgi:hypothetical protein
MPNAAQFLALTFHTPIVVNAVSTRALLHLFPLSLSLPFALIFSHLVMSCTRNLPSYECRGAHNMPG